MAGKNSAKLLVKLGRKLKPGTYRATLVAKDAAGNVSNTVRISFKVLGRTKARARR